MRAVPFPPHYMMAIDPGTKSTGVAFFLKSKLRSVTRIPFTTCAELHPFGQESFVDVLVCEVPQVYPRSKADPNDLIKLALLAGGLVGQTVAVHKVLVKPREWKGQVPKKIHNARTLAKLTPSELKLCGGLSHDEIDAVGLGLWYLGR